MNYGIPLERMRWGMVIGVTRLIHCAHIDDIRMGRLDRGMPWLRRHEHAEGPWCWVLDNPVPVGPWPYRGAQGLFDIPDGELDKVANRVLGLPF